MATAKRQVDAARADLQSKRCACFGAGLSMCRFDHVTFLWIWEIGSEERQMYVLELHWLSSNLFMTANAILLVHKPFHRIVGLGSLLTTQSVESPLLRQ
jgi:hypothetical protein